MLNKKLLVVCGPTATGKTGLGVKLAKKFNGEIVSADSRQIYKGMDIGTGKDLPSNSKFKILNPKQIQNSKFKMQNYQIGYYLIEGVKIWLYDVVEPDYHFSVADYVKCALVVIKDIWTQGKLPMLVGGTGFYIKAVVDGVGTMGIEPDWELRKKLSNLEIKKLREKLQGLDPKRWEKMNQSDRNNPRRLIRAIEIAVKLKTQNPKPKTTTQNLNLSDVLMIGLTAPSRVLYQRIDKRVEERVKMGVEREIRGLLKRGYGWDNSALGTTIGYKEWQPYMKSSRFKVQGSRLQEEAIQRWRYNEHHYARRQMTWFRKDKRVRWFDITQGGWQDRVERLIEKWYSKNNG